LNDELILGWLIKWWWSGWVWYLHGLCLRFRTGS